MNAPMTTPPTYAYDATHAAAADQGGAGKFLDESGAYVGAITYARAVQSSKGGWGVEIAFEADDGRKTKYPMTLWTIAADGSRQFGHDILDTVLICAGMKPAMAMKPGKVKYTVYDFDLRADVEKEGDGYPGLTGKRIGLLIQRELYTTKAGKDAARHSIYGAFDAETRQAASEKLEGKDAAITEKRLASLKDRDSRTAGAPAGSYDNGFSAPNPAPAAGSFNDMTDDIPF
jgi:single-strand DNA-binding protein